jgi:hypothetical protein
VSGGTFAPGGIGAGDATNPTGAFTMQSGGALHFDLSAPQTPPTAGGDQIQVAGNITLAGTLTVNNLGAMAEGTYTLMTYTGTASGSFATTNMPGGFNGSVSVDTGNKRVNLVVTPSVTVPTVNNANGATNVTQTTACFNGSVTSTGGAPTTAFIYWGASDGGATPANWANSVNMGIQSGSFATTVTGLTVNTTYYYRCYATNSAGSAWAATSTNFTTTSTNFTTQILNGPVFRIW